MKTATFVLFATLLFFGEISCLKHNLVSPCPKIFVYENDTVEDDRIYAKITLLSDFELHGVWARLIFDKPSIQLGNTFGQAIANDDHTEYLLKNPSYKLFPNAPHEARIFVRFTPGEAPPQLRSIRLNAKTVCPEGVDFDEPNYTTPAPTGEFFLSDELTAPKKH